MNIQNAETVAKVTTILLGKGPWVWQFLHNSRTKDNEAEGNLTNHFGLSGCHIVSTLCCTPQLNPLLRPVPLTACIQYF